MPAPPNLDRELMLRMIAAGLRDQPMQNPLGRSLHGVVLEAAPGEVRLSFDVGPAFVHAEGFVQGGIIATLLDFGAAFAALSRIPLDQTVTSVSLNVNFLRGARPGRFTVTGELEKLGRRMVYTRASVSDSTDQLVATATSPLVVIA